MATVISLLHYVVADKSGCKLDVMVCAKSVARMHAAAAFQQHCTYIALHYSVRVNLTGLLHVYTQLHAQLVDVAVTKES